MRECICASHTHSHSHSLTLTLTQTPLHAIEEVEKVIRLLPDIPDPDSRGKADGSMSLSFQTSFLIDHVSNTMSSC